MEIKLIDGKVLKMEDGATGLDVAKSISSSLAKKSVGYVLNEKVYDLDYPIKEDGDFRLILSGDKESYDILNHSTSHLLAHAVKHLYPDVLFGFGPSIEEGFYYDIDFKDHILSETEFAKIEKEMNKIASSAYKIERQEISKEEALELFKDDPYKLELIEGIDGNISIYKQGDFFDLCAGPHLASTNLIKHFKLLSLAGAYWRGDSNNKQLTRIYGTSFFTKEELEKHLKNLEERKKRDHRRLGKELELFMLSDYGPGFPFWLPNGYVLRRTLEDFWIQTHYKNGYQVISTPIMLSKELWETSGHWANYQENMYTTTVDEKVFAIKPMNCPGSILVYKNSLHSYKDLPIRLGELGLVHRHEASGALNGLFRVRTFTQDDAHIFLREDQMIEEIKTLLKLYDQLYSVFGLDYSIELSTRPEHKYIGDIAIWDKAEEVLKEACIESGRSFKINPGDGAFYGPKLDFKLRDSMNRIWQCGTIQLDMNLPERFDISYIDQHGEKVRPIMLHRAIYGSIERFLGILIENFTGAFPTWLAPVQVNLLPVAPVHQEYALKIKNQLESNGIRVTIDSSNEKLGYRLRSSQVKKIPYTIVLGDSEVNNNSITYRLYSQQEQITVSYEEFLKLISEEIASRALRK